MPVYFRRIAAMPVLGSLFWCYDDNDNNDDWWWIVIAHVTSNPVLYLVSLSSISKVGDKFKTKACCCMWVGFEKSTLSCDLFFLS